MVTRPRRGVRLDDAVHSFHISRIRGVEGALLASKEHLAARAGRPGWQELHAGLQAKILQHSQRHCIRDRHTSQRDGEELVGCVCLVPGLLERLLQLLSYGGIRTALVQDVGLAHPEVAENLECTEVIHGEVLRGAELLDAINVGARLPEPADAQLASVPGEREQVPGNAPDDRTLWSIVSFLGVGHSKGGGDENEEHQPFHAAAVSLSRHGVGRSGNR
mmetsp:Transcript_5462/g.15219  ORF Transcript_5462/g.15219 Transcript_5462/m.15219 type:complete len:219 (-) Transcript_5462:167-823(-)